MNYYDKVRVRYDECIWFYINYWFKVMDEGFQFRVVWLNVIYYIEFFIQCVGFINVDLQVFVVEFIVMYVQVVMRLAGIYCICFVGKSVVYIFQVICR